MATFLFAKVRRLRLRTLVTPLLGGLLVTACGGASSGGAGQNGVTNAEVMDSGGALHIVAPNRGGTVSRLTLDEVSWGRLVDVYDVVPTSNTSIAPKDRVTSATPLYRDFVIGQDIEGDDVDYRIESNPITHKQKLVILRSRTSGYLTTAERTAEQDEYKELLLAAADLAGVNEQNDDGSTSGTISMVPRNACVVLRFNDFLKADPTEIARLRDHIKVLTGYAPSTPFPARVVFDSNFGGLSKGTFFPTRILVDLTVSPEEPQSASLAFNSLGLPESDSTRPNQPNISVRIPTRVDTAEGQFSILQSLSGARVATVNNGPVDEDSPLQEVVRAFRSGNSTEGSNGFLADRDRPQIVGAWTFEVLPGGAIVVDEDAGTYEITFTFKTASGGSTLCRRDVKAGNILEIGPHRLEVTSDVVLSGSTAVSVPVRNATSTKIANVQTLNDVFGTFLSIYDPEAEIGGGTATQVPDACWVSFTPSGTPPVTETGAIIDIETTAVATVRFSEPMDPNSVSALDGFDLIRGAVGAAATPTNRVVGVVQSASGLDSFQFVPLLPLDHTSGLTESYHITFSRRPRDLAGNSVVDALPDIGFSIASTQSTESNGGVVMTFNDADEVGLVRAMPDDDPIVDLRGQVFYDLVEGSISPRTVQFASYVADRTQAVPALMTPLPTGVQDPLIPLGSKLHTLWRYCDVGFRADDETKYDLDVIGVNFAPVGGQVISDFFEEFEMSLAHASDLPDADTNANGILRAPDSGLVESPASFDENVVDEVLRKVHERSLGFHISPIKLFTAESGTAMHPFPMNQEGGPSTSFTWRDTSVTSTIPNRGFGLPIPDDLSAGNAGSTVIASSDPIPSIGMPLLMEFKCYPSNRGIGVNALDVSIAFTGSTQPNFRSYTSGGTDQSGTDVKINPDQADVPAGGFNAFSVPPGAPTSTDADNTFYLGQVDTVVRVSRAHTIWFDLGGPTDEFFAPVLEPDARNRPVGTDIVIDFRGANSFNTAALTGTKFADAANLDMYGDLKSGAGAVTEYHPAGSGRAIWYSSILEINGAQYVQMRLSFINDVASRQRAKLSALGLAYTN